jgi:arsenate reductase
MRLYHNPVCSKSRAALALLEARGVAFEIVEYLQAPPDADTLGRLRAALGLPARALLRDDGAVFAALGLADPAVDEAQILAAIAAHPQLLQRPILEAGGRAVIGRPPERVLELLD